MSDAAPIVIAGKLVVDEILWCDHPVLPGSSQRAREWTVTGGGQVWHTSRAVVRAGWPCRVAGWAGADPESNDLRTALVTSGVEDRLVTAGRGVRSTVIVGPDGDRSIISRSGLATVTAQALASTGSLDGAVALHIDAYVLDEIGGAAVIALAAEAASRGLPISLEPTSPRRLELAVHWLRQLPPLSAIVGRPDEVDATAPFLAAAPVLRVLHDAWSAVRVVGPDEVVVVPVPEADIETTGAGDRFTGGWLVGQARGLGVRECVELGIASAQATTERP